jgi:hypothetical protein
MANDKLGVTFLDAATGVTKTEAFINLDLTVITPCDLIQFVYQRGNNVSKPNPGSTTIWKMGRVQSGDPNPFKTPPRDFFDPGQPCDSPGTGNDLTSGENVGLWEL